ncbi:hypothetical protein [Natrarchaeobaculum aegyptiacum]|uniref:DUF8055 domain-containing protein n=1 Tax=Natrarchaeobaculum aegyptiacum TaxID=745377 RepID=A0A2Z2HPG1_9EURY|nr:hypothetical protein [Natrarchaeobaculum aegyptiacum]ARS88909.1 hypothetical protein B1756_03505 [Natrarchaeobaculum aegyptiacum]
MSRYGPRIAALARQAERDRAAFDDERQNPRFDDPEKYLREGVGPAVWCYVEARTGGRLVPFSEAEFEALTDAVNAWLECYALAHDVDLDADVSLRVAAELLLETRNVHDVGQLLTGVPERQH